MDLLTYFVFWKSKNPLFCELHAYAFQLNGPEERVKAMSQAVSQVMSQFNSVCSTFRNEICLEDSWKRSRLSVNRYQWRKWIQRLRTRKLSEQLYASKLDNLNKKNINPLGLQYQEGRNKYPIISRRQQRGQKRKNFCKARGLTTRGMEGYLTLSKDWAQLFLLYQISIYG